MAVTRFNERAIITTKDEQYTYSDIFKKRGLKSVENFATAELKYPTLSEIINLREEKVIWTVGTKYFKLAKEYYDDEQYWWVIAWYNLRPLETDFKPGDVVLIPLPLEDILTAYELI